MNKFTEQAIKVIVSVPAGQVLTYGQVARLAGSPRAARQVGWLLNSMSDRYKIPWHRIINSKGVIALKNPQGACIQKMLLESEGVCVVEGKIDLKVYLWSIQCIAFDQIDLQAFEVKC